MSGWRNGSRASLRCWCPGGGVRVQVPLRIPVLYIEDVKNTNTGYSADIPPWVKENWQWSEVRAASVQSNFLDRL